MSKQIKDAARVVVQAWATKQNLQWPVENLRNELALDGDRSDLAKAFHARRATDNTERMQVFRSRFLLLLGEFGAACQSHETAKADETAKAIEQHLFGSVST